MVGDKRLAADGAADYFGRSVWISDDTAVIGRTPTTTTVSAPARRDLRFIVAA